MLSVLPTTSLAQTLLQTTIVPLKPRRLRIRRDQISQGTTLKARAGGACERALVYLDAPRFSAPSEDKRQRERRETTEQGRNQSEK